MLFQGFDGPEVSDFGPIITGAPVVTSLVAAVMVVVLVFIVAIVLRTYFSVRRIEKSLDEARENESSTVKQLN
jgi:ABC-type siderophore export system fused ATPase/permease subunit